MLRLQRTFVLSQWWLKEAATSSASCFLDSCCCHDFHEFGLQRRFRTRRLPNAPHEVDVRPVGYNCWINSLRQWLHFDIPQILPPSAHSAKKRVQNLLYCTTPNALRSVQRIKDLVERIPFDDRGEIPRGQNATSYILSTLKSCSTDPDIQIKAMSCLLISIKETEKLLSAHS